MVIGNKKIKKKHNGIFVISLDFELYWGMFDKIEKDNYANNILGTRKAINEMLSLFKRYSIHATWAAVGFLFFNNKADLLKYIPQNKPNYTDPEISAYEYLNEGNIGENEREDPFHYGKSLINLISQIPYQEIGTHTFSHYYCLEPGQSKEEFMADLRVARDVGDLNGFKIQSIVFPRDQVNNEYIGVLKALGIHCFRGSENHWIYKSANERKKTVLVKRVFRLADSYIKLSGHNTYKLDDLKSYSPINVPASRFLRPYDSRLKLFENMKINRILKDMSYAARNNEIYHLWWHPHNFGNNIDKNLNNLKVILDHYSLLKDKFGMESLNMKEVAEIAMLDEGSRR